MKIPKPNTP